MQQVFVVVAGHVAQGQAAGEIAVPRFATSYVVLAIFSIVVIDRAWYKYARHDSLHAILDSRTSVRVLEHVLHVVCYIIRCRLACEISFSVVFKRIRISILKGMQCTCS